MVGFLERPRPTQTPDRGSQQRHDECPEKQVHAYPFKFDSRLTSIDSNRPTMRWTRMPRTRTASMTSNAIPSSTMSGIPVVTPTATRKTVVLHSQ